MKKAWLLVLLLLVVPVMMVAQEVAPEATEALPDWGAEFIALLLSGGVTVAVVQLLRRLGVVNKIPGALRPIIASFIGMGAVMLSQYLGFEVDFSPLVALFAAGGGSAVMFLSLIHISEPTRPY